TGTDTVASLRPSPEGRQAAHNRRGLDDFGLPATFAKQDRADDGDRRERDGHRDEDTEATEPDGEREHPGDRNLPEPEAERVDERRRAGVAGAVERADDHHREGEERKADREGAERGRADGGDLGSGPEDADDGVGEEEEHEADGSEEDEVVARRDPHRLLGA